MGRQNYAGRPEARYEKCVHGFWFENLRGEETAWDPRVDGRIV